MQPSMFTINMKNIQWCNRVPAADIKWGCTPMKSHEDIAVMDVDTSSQPFTVVVSLSTQILLSHDDPQRLPQLLMWVGSS